MPKKGYKQTEEHKGNISRGNRKGLSFEDNFWSKVKKTKGCWEWIGAKNRDNYGVCKLNGKMIATHRKSWEICKGKIPKGIFVLHLCDNPPCVRPSHLWLGNHSDNMRDAIKKGKISKNKLTETKVRAIRKLYKAGNIIHKKLAKQFRVHPRTIGNVINKDTWKYV